MRSVCTVVELQNISNCCQQQKLKLPNILFDFNETLEFLNKFSQKSSKIRGTKIRPVGGAMIHADRHDESNGNFSPFMRTRLNTERVTSKIFMSYYECVSLFEPWLSGMQITSVLSNIMLSPVTFLLIPHFSTLSENIKRVF
jgi:hypothetical protein